MNRRPCRAGRDAVLVEVIAEQQEAAAVCAMPVTRRNVLRATTAGTAALALGLAGTGCSRVNLGAEPGGGTLLKRLRDRGSVRIGFANESPYSFLNTDAEITGEAAEVAKVVFPRLGVPKLEPVQSEFGALISGLKVGLFDVIGAGMAITPTRCKQVLFTNPEFSAPAAFLVPKGNPKNVRTFADISKIPDFRLGVLSGAVEADYATGNGVPEENLVTLADQPSALDAVRTNRIDAFALTTISLKDAMSKAGNVPLEITPPFQPTVDGKPQYTAGAFAFLPDQLNIVNEFNKVLADMKRSGELLRVQRPFWFTEAEQTKLTSQELCEAPA